MDNSAPVPGPGDLEESKSPREPRLRFGRKGWGCPELRVIESLAMPSAEPGPDPATPHEQVAGPHHDSKRSERNGLYLGIDLAMFMAALGLLGHSTIVPLFISKVSSDPLAIGLLATAFQLGWLPQIFIAGYVERSQRKLPLLIRYTVLERIPSIGLTLCALAAISSSNGEYVVPVPFLLGAVYICRFCQSVASGLAVPPWMDIIARVVPGERRGRFMGNWTMIGRALGVGTAALTAPILEWIPFPYNFAACSDSPPPFCSWAWCPSF